MAKWQDDFALKQDLRQIDLELFEHALRQQPAASLRTATGAVANGALLRAAIAAGWIVSPECKHAKSDNGSVYLYNGKDVDALPPGAVHWLGQQIDAAYNDAYGEVPENL